MEKLINRPRQGKEKKQTVQWNQGVFGFSRLLLCSSERNRSMGVRWKAR